MTNKSNEDLNKPVEITEEFLLELYPELPNLYKIINTKPKNAAELKLLCLHPVYGKFWRLNNLYQIKDRNGKVVVFRMNDAQWIVYSHLKQHNRLMVLKSRQRGLTTLWLVSNFDDIMFNSNWDAGLISFKNDLVERLLYTIKFMWDNLKYPSIKRILGLKDRHKQNSTRIFRLSNGSSIAVGRTFRSTTLQRLHITEIGEIADLDPKFADEIETGSLETVHEKGIVVIESTAKGRNKFYDDWKTAMLCKNRGIYNVEDFCPVFLSWLEDPKCQSPILEEDTPDSIEYFKGKPEATQEQKNWWISAKRRKQDLIYQEYPANDDEAFFASVTGSFYYEIYKRCIKDKKERVNLYNPDLPLQVAMDLGINDPTFYVFFQVVDNNIMIVDDHQATDSIVKNWVDYLKLRLKGNRYSSYDRIILPHDAAKRSTESGKQQLELMKDYGLSDISDDTHVLHNRQSGESETNGLVAGILTVKQKMEEGLVYIDPVKCKATVNCIVNYKALYDKTACKYLDRPPKTGEFNHGADALRYAIVGCKKADKSPKLKRNFYE